MLHKVNLRMLAAFGFCVIGHAAGIGQVTVSFGTIEGNALEHVDEFLGIPYAENPERFAPPKQWNHMYTGGHLTAKAYTPQCMQDIHGLPISPGSGTLSEDCLHLNVYAPRTGTGSKAQLPVMLWIHGGSLVGGSAMDPSCNGTVLSTKENVVVVAINYRLGAFGFTVVRRGDGTSLGNNGFRDQREGMRWVRNNIGAFGGNSRSITLFGESAGGQSAVTHVLSRGSAGLFDRAIAESADFEVIESLTTALNHSDTLAKNVGCHDAGDLACLKKTNASQLASYYTALKAIPSVVDGDVYADFPIALVEKDLFNRVPLIIGNNAEEANLFVYPPIAQSTLASATELQCMYNYTFGGDDAQKIAEMYLPDDVPGIDNRPMLVELMSDMVFHCSTNQLAQALASKAAAPWVYSFRHRPVCNPMGFGACHASEIAFVFNNMAEILAHFHVPCKPSATDLALSAKMGSLWATFARTDIPDKDWKRTTSTDTVVLKLEASTVHQLDFETGYRRSQCQVVDAVLDTEEKYGAIVNRVFDAIPNCQKQAELAILV